MFIVLCEFINIYLISKEMACINIFISHSSADKALVRTVVEILGNNGITVDEYVFESGERTEDEINISIENSGIFCLLISESSMGKDWVLKEIAKYKSIIDSGKKMKFLPLIREFGIRKSSKEFRLCHSFRMYGQSIRLVVKEAISSECGADVDHEAVHRAVA